jgi:hypothetical protein
MKKILFTLMLGLAVVVTNAQLYVASGIESVLIKSGETFFYEGLTLNPTADFTISNTTLTRTDANTIVPTTINNYITRYFNFTNVTPAFIGSITFSYSGASLNGLTESNLSLNIKTSSAWTAVGGTVVSASSHLQATSLNIANGLKTLTLASRFAAVPVTWLKFTADKRQKTSVLSWSTASEQNTQDFLVQHSTNSSHWVTIGNVMAAGNASLRKDYTFTHQTPATGYNYYRLIQRDKDERFSYSKVATVHVDEEDFKLKVFPNPVQGGEINVVLKEPAQVRIFDANGRQVASRWLAAGLQTIDVSAFKKGIYFIKANTETITITIK